MSNKYEKPDLYNADCMEAMKEFPDKFFDLAVVDPPYGDAGIGGGVQQIRRMVEPIQRNGTGSARGSTSTRIRREQKSRGGGDKSVTRTGGTWAEKYGKKNIAWDIAPGKEYFEELFRVSRNQIIWGGNYFDLPPTRCFLIWKKLSISENFSMAMAEYAWTSFNENAKVYECTPQGNPQDPRFHPTQKPVNLYSWILDKYAKKGDKILDTHAGSASSLIACHMAGLDGWGFEINEGYYKKAKLRLDNAKDQISIFELI